MEFFCNYCNYKCKKKYNLRRHILTKHLPSSVVNKKKKTIKCFNCSSKFNNREELAEHVTTVHTQNMEAYSIDFQSENEFVEWKKAIEIKNRCRYIQKEGVREHVFRITKYFYCHRDGTFLSKASGSRKRLLKSQGSNKTGYACTSRIIYNELLSGAIKVRFINTHWGHGDNTGRINLTKNERSVIAGKIKDGVPFDTILDSIRDRNSDVLSPIALTAKQDLRNIVRDFGLSPWKGHVNDAVSVDLWFNKVSAADGSPIIFYKRQGEIDERLEKNDILLIIANQFQRKMFTKFGSNIICTDSTHGTNQYDFHLTTIVVVDEYGAGIPVSYCISNKKDSITFTILYEKLKNHSEIGVIRPKVFMSDDDDTFYNAWSGVMGPVPHRLLCTWHVDRAWRQNLISKVTGQEKHF